VQSPITLFAIGKDFCSDKKLDLSKKILSYNDDINGKNFLPKKNGRIFF